MVLSPGGPSVDHFGGREYFGVPTRRYANVQKLQRSRDWICGCQIQIVASFYGYTMKLLVLSPLPLSLKPKPTSNNKLTCDCDAPHLQPQPHPHHPVPSIVQGCPRHFQTASGHTPSFSMHLIPSRIIAPASRSTLPSMYLLGRPQEKHEKLSPLKQAPPQHPKPKTSQQRAARNRLATSNQPVTNW